jgi:hypothetical protein
MMRLVLPATMLAALLSLAPSVQAARLGAGNSMIWVGLDGNKSQIVGPTTGAGNMFEADEVGVHGAYSYFISNAWTVIVSGGFDVGNQKFEPAAGPSEKFTTNSINVRIGMDRYAFITDDVALYAGPGLLYWRGNGEYDGSGVPSFDRNWPDVTQVGFSGRIGMLAKLGGGYGLFGHIGQVIAMNSAKDDVGKNTWWTNHHNGAVGLSFNF